MCTKVGDGRQPPRRVLRFLVEVKRVSPGGVVLLGLLVLLVVMTPKAAATPTAQPAGPAAPAAAPAGLVAVAQAASRQTGIDADVLLAISWVECRYGRCRAGQPDTLVPPDLRRHVDAASMLPGGSTAVLLGLLDGRRIGDWVNPQAVAGGQHAMGFMQFLPTTWRQEARLAPGHPEDPYSPRDSMVVAGSYLARLESGAALRGRRNIRGALAVYGGSDAYAQQVLDLLAAD